MLKKALTTTVLATVLLTSLISANDTTKQSFSGSTAKVERIGVFDNIPTQGLNTTELNEKGKYFSNPFWWTPTGIIYESYKGVKRTTQAYQSLYWYQFSH